MGGRRWALCPARNPNPNPNRAPSTRMRERGRVYRRFSLLFTGQFKRNRWRSMNPQGDSPRRCEDHVGQSGPFLRELRVFVVKQIGSCSQSCCARNRPLSHKPVECSIHSRRSMRGAADWSLLWSFERCSRRWRQTSNSCSLSPPSARSSWRPSIIAARRLPAPRKRGLRNSR